MKSKLIPFFCDAGEEFCHIFSLIERISKQQLLSTYHDDDSLPIKRSDGSGELTVSLCEALCGSRAPSHHRPCFGFVVSALFKLMFR
jgi:hypothetical protein